jgi:DNA invertase Pin-like site-specific DNA recombinase
MRLVGYVRASTDEQELSPEVQAERLRAIRTSGPGSGSRCD